MPDAKGECSVTMTAPTATDSCKRTIAGTTNDPLSYSEQGTYTITWKYDDGNGNTAIQTQKIEVKDVPKTTPNISSLPDINGDCSVTVTNTPTATNNCKGAIPGITNSPLYYDTQGTYTIIWKFYDAAGNVTTQNQTVVVKDATASVIVCPKNQTRTIPASKNSDTASGAEFDLVSTSDNCTIASVTNDFNNQPILAGAIFPIGTTTVMWKAYDNAGNVATVNFTITVNKSTGIDNPACQAEIKLCPNPVAQDLFIKADSRIETVSIFDINGRLVSSSTYNSHRIEINVQQMKQEIYMVKIRTIAETTAKKFTRQ